MCLSMASPMPISFIALALASLRRQCGGGGCSGGGGAARAACFGISKNFVWGDVWYYQARR